VDRLRPNPLAPLRDWRDATRAVDATRRVDPACTTAAVGVRVLRVNKGRAF
jgi:hypothetical protein